MLPLNTFKRGCGALAIIALAACGNDTAAPSQPKLTAADAAQFLADAQADLQQLQLPAVQAAWVYQNFITEDSAALSAHLGEKLSSAAVRYAVEAAKFNNVEVDADTRRQLELLKQSLTLPAPADPAKSAELAQIGAELDGMYGKGKYCRDNGECLSLPDMTLRLANSRDPAEQLELWTGWREVSPPMKPLYVRQTEIANEGAKELGFTDLSDLWRAKYDMPSADFGNEVDRLWGQVKPFYDALHCHVRAELGNYYGEDIVPQDQPIPAHLLGNMWAQSWGNIYDIVKPKQDMRVVDVTQALKDNNVDQMQMVKTGEAFFSSLGFDPLPETFWQRSLITKPADRDVVCHASAWNIDDKDDIRIKMCTQQTGEDFQTVHHELGHNYYQRAYKNQPLLYRGSAHDGFHEAVGDTIGLSITPKYLKEIGLIDEIPDASNDIGMLMQLALEKIAFLPFSVMVDQWRWKVFAGEVAPADYNKVWWELREKYQGVRAPIDRPAEAFDPGAKYHIPGNTPYTRYFLAHILQFQLHEALCEIAGNDGPINRCTIYGNKEAGKALNALLEMGMSKPWPDALEAIAGTREMNGTAIANYFAPLKTWLDEQNQGRQCGW
jgi:peptidyl-dipeptidase A